MGVSIPNGMEFYGDICSSFHKARAVSIPNGMEFYHPQSLLRAPL